MFRRFVFPLALSALIGVALVSSSSVGQAAPPPPCQDSTCVQPRVGFSCPPGMVWTRINGQAACDYCDTATQPPTDTQTLSCPAPQVGSIVQERAYVCNQPTNSWIPGPWNTVSNSCAFGACPGPAPAPDTQTVACPVGQTGSITQERTYACSGAPSFTWNAGPWVETSNTCAGASCPGQNPGPETQTVACPVGQTGSITQQRTWSCSGAPSWIYQPDAWVEISNTCTPSAVTCPGGPVGWGGYCAGSLPAMSVGETAGATNETPVFVGSASFQCGGGGAWVEMASSCGCPVGFTLIGGVCQSTPVDYCLNIPGDQPSVPGGYNSTTGAPGGYCCPLGQNWNGSACVAAGLPSCTITQFAAPVGGSPTSWSQTLPVGGTSAVFIQGEAYKTLPVTFYTIGVETTGGASLREVARWADPLGDDFEYVQFQCASLVGVMSLFGQGDSSGASGRVGPGCFITEVAKNPQTGICSVSQVGSLCETNIPAPNIFVKLYSDATCDIEAF